MRTILCAAGMAALLAAGPAQAQETPRELIERAIKAHGGMDRLAKARADWVRVKGTLMVGDKEAPFRGETTVQLPGQFKSVLEVSFDDHKTTVVQTLNGETAWVTIDGQPQAKIPAAALAEMKGVMHLDRVIRLVPLLTDKAYELIATGDFKVDGRAALGVKVVTKGHRDIVLYFDKESGLLVKTEHALDDSRNREVRQEEYFSDFKEVGGYTRPTRLTVYRDGKKTMAAELIEVKYYEKIEDKIFAKP
jgi:hypothetical protein